MNFQTLQKVLAITNGEVTVAPGALTPNIDDLITRVYGGQPVVISGATAIAGGTEETIAVRGTASLLNSGDVPVEASFRVDSAGNAQAVLRYTLIGAQKTDGGWRFSTSFPSMPKMVDWSKTSTDAAIMPLDELDLFDSSFVVVTQAGTDAESGANLESGINFVSSLQLSGLVELAATLFGRSDTLKLHGPIRVPLEVSAITALEPDQFPWSDGISAPGIRLQADLGLAKSFDKLTFGGILFRIYTPHSTDWLEANPSYGPVAAFTGGLTIPSAALPQALEVTAPIAIGASDLLIFGNFSGFSVGNLASLADIAGSDGLISQMPEQIKSVGDALGQLQLTNASIGVGRNDRGSFEVSSAAVTIGMPDLKWKVWPDHFEIDSISCRFEVASPFDSTKRQFDVTVGGSMQVEGVPIEVSANNRDGFTVYAALTGSQTIPLKQIISTYAPGIPAPSDLTVNAFAVSVAPGKSYSMAAAMAREPNPWTVPLGLTTLTVSDVSLGFVYPSGGPAAGSFAGTIGLGPAARVLVSYAVPGPLILNGNIPQIDLTDLARQVAGVTSLPFPSGFPDIRLLDSTVSFTGQKQNGATTYDFLLRTTVAIGSTPGFNLGAMVVKTQEATGFAAAIWTPKWAEGDGWSPGSLWQPLSVLTIDSAGLVISTLAPSDSQKGLLIPTSSVPAFSAAQFKIVPGVTFFATLSLTSGPVEILQEIFGSRTTFGLFASYNSDTRDTVLTAHLGLRSEKAAFAFNSLDLRWDTTGASSSSISLSAAGTLSIESETLQFAVAGKVDTDGTAALALNVRDWVHPFGYERLIVKDFGIAIKLADGVVIGLQGSFQFTTGRGKVFLFGVAGAIIDFEAPCALAFQLVSSTQDQMLTFGEVIEGITTIDVYNLPPGTNVIPWIGAIKLLDLFLKIQNLAFWAVVVDQVEVVGVTYKKGFGFRGQISLFGVKVDLYVEMRVAEKMFAGSVEFPDEIRLGSVLLLSRPATVQIDSMSSLAVSGKPATTPKGPAMAVSSVIDSTHKNYLYVAAHVELFDIVTMDVLGEATNDGIAFLFDLSAGTSGEGAWASQRVTLLVSREQLAFSAGLAYDFGLKNVTLGGFDLFGSLKIPEIRLPDFRIGVSGRISASLLPPKFGIGGSLTFEFMGLSLHPSFDIQLDLSNAPQKLGDFGALLLAWIKQNLQDLLKEVLNLVDKFVNWVKENFEIFKNFASEVAQILKDQFNTVSAEAVKALMIAAGWASDVASEAADTTFKICSATTALAGL